MGPEHAWALGMDVSSFGLDGSWAEMCLRHRWYLSMDGELPGALGMDMPWAGMEPRHGWGLGIDGPL